MQPSVHAAAKANRELPVTLTAFYNKLDRTETHVVEELVRGSSERLRAVREEIGASRAPVLAAYKVRVLDGNHLPASEKRLKPLRGSGAPRCRASRW